ncbi:regulatory signaling modulator protein AmpE [Bermanella marisrubri]|uniref:Membrane protein required for beta-lactamase induction n=1 Tax=Bermanella marisrubri TaxID=207949 RepID=Q1MZQ5_9GAMM|nr:regulatory signaling modulator protein AmpE [Bermanella marisrubri]EAT11502.1 Membrane protein required for beta-lactamase induction [Oceanobacter sp. RED65] [Bermanella marisrubri]QIZ85076.1 regulatory signaling modulator protein AmpE [Bermanella marisrubri]
MKFIVLLFTVLLQRQTRKEGYERNRRWFKRLLSPFHFEQQSKTMQIMMYVGVVVLPCVALSALIERMDGLLGSFVSLLLQVALLLYILGRDNVSQKFKDYKNHWHNQDYQAAFYCARNFLSLEEQAQTSPYTLHTTVSKALIRAWFMRFFVFVFWYLLAGIGGAMFCLLSYWFYSESKIPWMKSVLDTMEWLPSRLLALSMSLAGDFNRSFSTVSKLWTDFQTNADQALGHTLETFNHQQEKGFDEAGAARTIDESNRLMLRCAILWLLVVAFLTIFAGF